MADTEKLWTMPAWMEPYRELIRNTGGNSVEDLVNSDADARVNLPLAMLAACVTSQVGLLNSLRARGLLMPVGVPMSAGHRSHLWLCGCLINDADAHRVGCPEYPERRCG